MLKNKVALVTGASSGIGRAIALVWAREGAKVVVSDVNVQAGEETAALVCSAGGDAIFVAADVGKPEDCDALVQRTVAHYGRLDVACNNAGIGGPQAPTADYPLDGWAQVININLSGVFYGMKYQIAAMLKNGGGSIINMASILGSVGFATAPAYTAAKHGVVGLTHYVAAQLGTTGITVNTLSPGMIPWSPAPDEDAVRLRERLADMTPVGRNGTPEDFVTAVVFLAAEGSSFVNGANIIVDGGWSIW